MPGLDVTPRPAAGRQIISGYGNGGFKVAGQHWQGSILVLADRTLAWAVTTRDDVTLATLAPVLDAGVRVLLVGCGRSFQPPPRPLTEALAAVGVALEWMDTGAACRTFNVLLLEDRDVGAALLAVD
jgi:uncharacterized protein